MRIRNAALVLTVLCGTASWVFGCSGDDTATTTSDAGSKTDGAAGGETGADSASATTGTIRATTVYNGVKKGPIVLAVFSTVPPSGPPVGRALIEMPASLPGSNEADITKVPPGDWFAEAFIVASDDSPQHRISPRPTDPFGATKVTVVAGGSLDVTIELKDGPTPMDGGSDSGDGGDGG